MTQDQHLTDSEIERLAAEYIAADWTPDRYYRDMNLIAFARALLQQRPLPVREGTEEFALCGNVCEIGDVLPDTPGFRLVLEDDRIITVTGLTRDEVRALPFLDDVTLTLSPSLPVREEPTPIQPPEFQEATWGVDSVMRSVKSMAISEYRFRLWCEANSIALASSPSVQNSTNGADVPRGSLTKEEVDALVYRCRQEGDDSTYALVRAVETALGVALPAKPDLTDALETFDEALSNWARAYPLSVFPEPNLAEVRAVLESKGITIDSVSASNMRHVVTELNKLFQPVRDALAAGVDVPPAPPGWWTEELERIFTAKRGAVITDDMKRAAGIALQVARGQRWDDEKQEWTAGVNPSHGGSPE